MENGHRPVDFINHKVTKLGPAAVDKSLLDPTLTKRGRYRAFVALQEKHQTGSVGGGEKSPVSIVPDLEALENRIRVRTILMGRGSGTELPPVS